MRKGEGSPCECVCVCVLLAVCVAVDVAVEVGMERILCKLLERCKQKTLHSFGRVFKLTRQYIRRRLQSPPSQSGCCRAYIYPPTHTITHTSTHTHTGWDCLKGFKSNLYTFLVWHVVKTRKIFSSTFMHTFVCIPFCVLVFFPSCLLCVFFIFFAPFIVWRVRI